MSAATAALALLGRHGTAGAQASAGKNAPVSTPHLLSLTALWSPESQEIVESLSGLVRTSPPCREALRDRKKLRYLPGDLRR